MARAREFLGIEGGHQPWSMERFDALYRGGLQWIYAANPEHFIDKSACGNGKDTRIALLILGQGQFDVQVQGLSFHFFVLFARDFVR